MSETAEEAERKRGTRCCGEETSPRLDLDDAETLAFALDVLANPLRLQILEVLARNEGSVCVCDLEDALPIKQPTISHHLKLLRTAGLVDCERRGVWAYYFANRDALAALRGNLDDYFAGLE